MIHFLHKIPSKNIFQLYSRYFNKSNAGMVITLHRVIPFSESLGGLNNFIEISVDKLEKVIRDLKKLNVKFVSLDEMENYMGKKNRNQPIVHFSFDDGYLDNYVLAYPLFKKYNIPFTIFIVSDFIENEHPFLWWYILENIIENKIPVSFEKYDFEITHTMYLLASKEQLFAKFRILLMENVDRDSDYFKEKLNGYINQNDNFLPGMLSWKHVNNMIASGLCEIGNHTKTHARFSKLNQTQKITEIEYCENEIKIHTAVMAKYFAYPYGSMEDIVPVGHLHTVMQACRLQAAFTTIPHELNIACDKSLMPRIFLNNATTIYTLKTRLDGTYQRNCIPKHYTLNNGTFK